MRPRRRWSDRLPADLTPNPVSLAVKARRDTGQPLIDLTETNPTRAGFRYPADLLAPLADPAGLAYDPRPLGLPAARAAVAADHARRGLEVPASRIALTSSTSEAYSLLFKLLCDPGDGVLVPRPSYPLFEHLTRLEAVRAVPYDLEYHGRWRLDTSSLARAVDERTRALLVVSPNNPTGSFLHRHDLEAMTRLCHDHGLALIGDEVFADYPLDEASDAVSVLTQAKVLTCALGGLSKSIGLPQAKLGWIAWSGPDAEVTAALDAYELVADSYLSLATPVQVAAPALLSAGSVVRAQIHERLRANLSMLRHTVTEHPDVTLLVVEGGWSAVLQVPATRSEDEMVIRLITDDGVLVHPGYFYDFAREAFLVVSLIVEPGTFAAGIERLFARVCGSRE
jgi:aspartate/methionine/tyrosine aminotransferase